VEQWREFVTGSEEEDGSDDEAVGGRQGGDDSLELGTMGAAGEDSGGGGGHEGVHDQKAGDEAEEAEEAAAGSAKFGSEEEEEELRGGFCAEAMDDAYDEDGAAVVAEGEGVRFGGVRVTEAAKTPSDVAGSCDEQGDAALGDDVMVGSAGFAAQEADEDVDSEDDEGRSDETLADGVHVRRKAEVKEDDGGSEDGDGKGVAKGVEEAEAHGVAPVALDTCDVGDGGEMVVVEAVAETKEGAGDESEFERGGHPV